MFLWSCLLQGLVARALVEQELSELWRTALPGLQGQPPALAVRQLRRRGQWLQASAGAEAEDCLLLDVYVAEAPQELRLDVDSVKAAPFASCDFHVFWAKGRGPALDWVQKEHQLCDLYHALLVEDEYLLDSFRMQPLRCRVFPLDPHEAAELPLIQLPWAPGEPLPRVTRAVSFHAYRVYSEEAKTNQQRWLQEPDHWNRFFTELSREEMLKVCLAEEDCEGDQAPYRLMFWEDISEEFLECIARGITPIWLGTAPIYEYVERNVLLTRWRFETAAEMAEIIAMLSSPQGILEYGTRVFMERQGNYFLSRFYWRQDPRLRALLLASAAERQQLLQLEASQAGGEVMELVACVTSAVRNRHQRDLIRSTWGSEPFLKTHFGLVRLRVLFFVGRGGTEESSDLVRLPDLEEDFSNIWVKTAAILKFGADYFKADHLATRRCLRFLLKCDDDAFVDIDAVVADLMASAPIGLLWGHVMALVEPNRIATDKYFVPHEVYPMQYYPPYARGMSYALSEDLVLPLGRALAEGSVEPFPYREDVSVGLYLLQLARRGEVRVVPHQRKDAMPLDFEEHCRVRSQPWPVIVMHRFDPDSGPCFWSLIKERRSAGGEVDFCRCAKGALRKVSRASGGG